MSYESQTTPIPYGWGGNSNQTLLKEDQVRDIRTKELTPQQYADKYNKSVSAVYEIQRGRSYKWVE